LVLDDTPSQPANLFVPESSNAGMLNTTLHASQRKGQS